MSLKNKAICILYFLFLIASSLYCYKKPLYNWDMLSYMALAAGVENHDIIATHEIVYNEAKKHVPEPFYSRLVEPTHEFKHKMFTDPVAFNDQLVFYTIKPLYIGLVYLSYKAGLSLSKATVAPSVISYFLIGSLLFVWLIKYMAISLAALISICTMLTAPLLNAAMLSTPDCLSGFTLFAAMYFILEHRKIFPVFLFFVLSIFARIDNVIAGVLIVSLLAFTRRSVMKISKKQYALMLAGFVICYFIISYRCVQYGWNILFYPSFAQHLDNNSGLSSHFSLAEYMRLAYSQILTGLFFYHLAIYLVMLLFVFVNTPPKLSKLNFDQLLALLTFFIIAVRFILLPEIDDRFYISWYLLIVMLLIRKLSQKVPNSPILSSP
jgi:hypothetical protein